jgi:hypothetical protein
MECGFDQINLTIYLNLLFTLFDDRADPGRRQHTS